jgi:acetyl esterase/lipase
MAPCAKNGTAEAANVARHHRGFVAAILVLAASGSDARPTGPAASARLAAPVSLCEEARLGASSARRGADGVFEFAVELTGPGTYRLQCGGVYEIDLAPGDRLTVTLDGTGKIRFSGRGAAANDYLSATAALSIPAMIGLAPQERSRFVTAWQSLYEQDLRRLRQAERQGIPRDFVERETVRLRFRLVQGRVMFPFFHWRETADERIVPDPEVPGLLRSVPIEDPRWWDLGEHQELLDALLHARARERLDSAAELRTGDNRWLRAKLDVLASEIADPRLRLREATRLIAKHVADDGSKSIEPILERWMTMAPDAESVKRVRESIAADRAHGDGHRRAVYREVGGIPLELHVMEPTAKDRAEPRPAMLWLHGGSGTEGTWWWSPGITKVLLENGIVVAAVEMTTGNRFNADADQFSDAGAAYRWLKEHAAEYRIDAQRIGVAGFSSGASTALLLATRGLAGSAGGGPAEPLSDRPAAVVAMGACADPNEDAWFRKTMARSNRSPGDFSPMALVGGGQPPLLAIHATADEYCGYVDMTRFMERYLAAGNEAELVSVRDARHFFGFHHKVGQQQVREAIAASLKRWGWSR